MEELGTVRYQSGSELATILRYRIFQSHMQGILVWNQTGQIANFTHWRAYEPNGQEERCTMYVPRDYSWNDMPCSSSAPIAYIQVQPGMLDTTITAILSSIYFSFPVPLPVPKTLYIRKYKNILATHPTTLIPQQLNPHSRLLLAIMRSLKFVAQTL